MNWKDVTQYSSAVGALASGVLLSFMQFIQQGDLTYNVLYYVAQMLIYSGSIFGVQMYYKGKFGELSTKVDDNKQKIDELNNIVSDNSSKEAV